MRAFLFILLFKYKRFSTRTNIGYIELAFFTFMGHIGWNFQCTASIRFAIERLKPAIKEYETYTWCMVGAAAKGGCVLNTLFRHYRGSGSISYVFLTAKLGLGIWMLHKIMPCISYFISNDIKSRRWYFFRFWFCVCIFYYA